MSSVVNTFYQSLEQGDFVTLRACLSDEFLFQGPFDTFNQVEPYIQALNKLHPIIKRIEMRHIFSDGDEVCALYDLLTNSPAGTAFVAEWFRVKQSKIAAIRVVFDPRPFTAMFAQRG